MATHLNLQHHQLFNHTSLGLDIRKRTTAYALHHGNSNAIDERNSYYMNSCQLVGSLSRCYTSFGKYSSLAATTKDHFSCTDQVEGADESSSGQGIEFNRVDCVVWILHESARSFSQAVESLGLVSSGPGLAMAWIGKDVREWHRRIAYQVAVYALMKTAIDLEILLSHERQNEYSPVREILTPLINQMGEHIEIRLKMRHPCLVQWFRDTEMPQVAGYFTPLLKNWSVEYAGSGELGHGRICCPILVSSLKDALVKLLDFSLKVASLDKLHQLATEAGFEKNFLSYFGGKVLPSEKIEDLEFWIGLAHKKLLKAFREENIISHKQISQHQIQSDSLATLGLFAYLGRRTRIFLSEMGIKDIDEMVKDFLSYLEFGILFIYPEFSSISAYQLFMEVVTDEIGWFDFYASYARKNCQEKRPKYQARQAEKEIIYSVVFTVCYDVFSGFAHFNRSTQQSLGKASLSYLLHCQGLLSICLQDHWAAYDRSGESLNIADHSAFDNHTSHIGSINGPRLPLVFEVQQKPHDLTAEGCPKRNSQKNSKFKKAPIPPITNKKICGKGSCISKPNPRRESFIKRYCIKLASKSADIWMGTVLLFTDIMVAFEILARQANGCKASRSKRKRLKRTMIDIIVLIPITILMLLPVTAVGHAAMLAAIKKYMPFLIPSSYSSKRLDIVKQMKQTKDMGDQSWSYLEDHSPSIS